MLWKKKGSLSTFYGVKNQIQIYWIMSTKYDLIDMSVFQFENVNCRSTSFLNGMVETKTFSLNWLFSLDSRCETNKLPLKYIINKLNNIYWDDDWQTHER